MCSFNIQVEEKQNQDTVNVETLRCLKINRGGSMAPGNGQTVTCLGHSISSLPILPLCL